MEGAPAWANGKCTTCGKDIRKGEIVVFCRQCGTCVCADKVTCTGVVLSAKSQRDWADSVFRHTEAKVSAKLAAQVAPPS